MLDVNGYVLPGTRDPYESCGERGFKKCLSHDYGKGFTQRCHRLACNRCVRRAGQRIARKIKRRLWLMCLKIKFETKGRKNPLPSHILESIPAGDIFYTFSKQKQTRLYKIFRVMAGITGGMDITHLWRFTAGKVEPYHSPHNHLIGLGWINDGGVVRKAILEKYGVDVVYKKIDTLKNRDAVYFVANYLLSHCAVKKDKAAYRWFGILANNKISNRKLKEYRDEEFIEEDKAIKKSTSCPECHESLYPAKINRSYPNWRSVLEELPEIANGCKVPPDLFHTINFLAGEKMVFYSEDYTEIYQKTKKQRDEERAMRHPEIFDKDKIARRTKENHKIKEFFS